MLKNLKKKEGQADPKKDTKKEVGLCIARNSPKRKPKSRRMRRRKKPMTPSYS